MFALNVFKESKLFSSASIYTLASFESKEKLLLGLLRGLKERKTL
jgi:hypothetical protein